MDIGKDAAARYRPALRKTFDHATAEIFVCLYRARLIAKSICEQCKSNLRRPGTIRPMFKPDIAGWKRTPGTAVALADCDLTISLAQIEALTQDPGPLVVAWSISN
jgi:hypothetical protein